MSKFLIIPQYNDIDNSIALANEYGFGFEFNDFFHPSMLDNSERIDERIARYKSLPIPDYCTSHGDFFDVIIFSEDKLIREISEKRVRQSMDVAVKLGVKGVVFHTNHNPQFNNTIYVNNWLSANVSFFGKILTDYPNMEVYIENMCDTRPEMITALAKEFESFDNFGICYDYAHASVFGSDIEHWTETVAPYVKHMHINDNDLVNDLHLAVGEGKIDWKRFKVHYDRYFKDISILIETSSVETQRRSALYLREIGIL